MRRRSLALRIAMLALAFPLLSAGPLLNPSFEPTTPFSGDLILPSGSTAIPGWITTDSGAEWWTPASFGFGFAAHGIAVVDLANYTFSAGGVKQTIATTPGEVVQITFMLGTSTGSGRDGTCEIQVSADGNLQTFSASNPLSTIVWNSKSFTFTADDASATLLFRCLQNANQHFANIDALALNTVVPAVSSTWGRVKQLYR